MSKTAIQKLAELGQSIWIDNISRSLIETGKLQEMIDLGLLGMTSNPTIFHKAVSSSNDYDEKIAELHKSGKSTFEIYDDLTVQDIQDAADIFKPVYEKTDGLDGYVSLEINPKLASKTKETIEEGKRLCKKVGRPNVMFKVPSTDAGFEAISALLAEGINVNVTLIFSLQQYINTAHAFLEGMSRLSESGKDLRSVCSVASIFVSRIDTPIDRVIDEQVSKEEGQAEKDKTKSLRGMAAVANSKIIYQEFLEIFSGDEFKQLKAKGANIQRVLWGSTSAKDPAYSDIKYVTELIGANTVNTVPDKTLEAFLDHGVAKESLTAEVQEAQKIIDDLKSLDIDVNSVCAKLLQEGVAKFEESFDALLGAIETKTRNLSAK